MKLHLISCRPFTALDVSFVSAEPAVAAEAAESLSPDKLKVILSLENQDGVVADFAMTASDAHEMCVDVLKALTGSEVGDYHEGPN